MKKNEHLESLLTAIPEDVRRELNYSSAIADSLDSILKTRGISQKQFASMMGKRESEISKWLCGTHNFTLRTIAKIETVLGEQLIHV